MKLFEQQMQDEDMAKARRDEEDYKS